MTEDSRGIIGWLESHLENSNAYKVVETYRVFTRGVELEVRILDQYDEPDEYRYLVEVENMETGERSQHGNGGATREEALDVFHWNSVLPPL